MISHLTANKDAHHMSKVFSETLESLIFPYTQRWNQTALDTRECLALVDLFVRLAWTLTLCESRRSGGNHRPAATPGMGAMLAVVRSVHKAGTFGNDSLGNAIEHVAKDVLRAIDGFRAPSFNSLKELRNRLDHGEALSANDTEAEELAARLRELCHTLRNAFITNIGTFTFDGTGEQIALRRDQYGLDMSPLWLPLPHAPYVGVYAHAETELVHYLIPGSHQRSSRSVAALKAFEKDWLAVSELQGVLSRFAKQISLDVAAYTEDNTAPDYHFGDDEESGWLFIPWTRATSDQNQPRLDRFRVGQNDEKQWRDARDQWQPYSAFLKEISNWPVIARRIGIGLADLSRSRLDEEAARLGAPPALNVRGPAQLVAVDSDLNRNREGTFDLEKRIDGACEVVKQSTEVFFLVGQAGLGKTELMLAAAQARAELLEASPDDPRPLYLFVSSTGRTLASLDDAVNSALNITKLLSSESAKVLCRNGLLVLIVDGFDELLGSSGYENALGSLEPWLRALDGRGVIVASARSSYYLTQYQRSLSEKTGLKVEHTLIALQAWSRSEAEQYLKNMQMPHSALEGLSDRDWRLLGIPFFAKAFSAWQRRFPGQHANQPLFEVVIGQFLDREASKLRNEHLGAPLLDEFELQRLFAEVAEMMLEQRTRELELQELLQCAQMAISVEHLERERPGLTNRLSAICAMSISTLTSKKFTFSHEIMFDCFLTLALESTLNRASDFNRIRRLLEFGKIQADVFEWLAERCPDNSAKCVESLAMLSDSSVIPQALRENVGTWWNILLRRKRGIPPSLRVDGLIMDDVDLSECSRSQLSMTNCQLRRLKLPARGEHRIAVRRTAIDSLEAIDVARIKAALHDVSPEFVGEILVGNDYVFGTREVRTWFIEQGIVLPDEVQSNSEARDAAEYFLRKMTTSLRVQVVVSDKDHLPDDPRLLWTQHYGTEEWVAFIERLLRHELAHLDPIQASGPAKARVAFDVPPARIRRPDVDNPKVVAFWHELELGP
jgi:hypothetical protein